MARSDVGGIRQGYRIAPVRRSFPFANLVGRIDGELNGLLVIQDHLRLERILG
jgi:hypothetical protein